MCVAAAGEGGGAQRGKARQGGGVMMRDELEWSELWGWGAMHALTKNGVCRGAGDVKGGVGGEGGDQQQYPLLPPPPPTPHT